MGGSKGVGGLVSQQVQQIQILATSPESASSKVGQLGSHSVKVASPSTGEKANLVQAKNELAASLGGRESAVDSFLQKAEVLRDYINTRLAEQGRPGGSLSLKSDLSAAINSRAGEWIDTISALMDEGVSAEEIDRMSAETVSGLFDLVDQSLGEAPKAPAKEAPKDPVKEAPKEPVKEAPKAPVQEPVNPFAGGMTGYDSRSPAGFNPYGGQSGARPAPQQAEKKAVAPQQAEKKAVAPQQAEKKAVAPQQAPKKLSKRMVTMAANKKVAQTNQRKYVEGILLSCVTKAFQLNRAESRTVAAYLKSNPSFAETRIANRAIHQQDFKELVSLALGEERANSPKAAPKAKTATASKGWVQFSSKEISDAKLADAALDREFEEFARQIAHPDDPPDVQQDADGWETFSDQEIKEARNQRTEELKQRAEALKQQAEADMQKANDAMAAMRGQTDKVHKAVRRFS